MKRKEMKEKKMKMSYENKGITLIALVITIIVLLILAAVSIATLTGENGILNQASRAADNTKNATEKEQVELAYNAQMSKNMEKGKYTVGTDEDDIKGLQEELNNLEAEAEAKKNGGRIEVEFRSGNKYRIQEGKVKGPIQQAKVGEKVKGENKEYTKNGTAEIPVGFAIVPELDDVSEGLVISDEENDTENKGNQFVWVPVEDFSEFERQDFGNQKITDFVTDTAADKKYYEPNPQTTDTEYTTEETLKEVKLMYASVKENGGFYIGRYEAGKDKNEKVVCKKGVTVYNNIKWSDSRDMTKETGGTVEKARNFVKETYTNNSVTVGVTSTLCYGVQWDAVMRWISKDKDLEKYLTNGAPDNVPKGVYGTSNPEKTGSKDEYQMKNIYDMAGNVWEWTMEAYGTDSRVSRGGGYDALASSNQVSYRGNNYPDIPHGNKGFRLALYVR